MPLFRKKKKKPQGLRLGVSLREEGVAVAAVAPEEETAEDARPKLLFCEHRLCQNDVEREGATRELVEVHQLAGAECTLTLQPTDYQLLRAEAPPVAADELRDAMRWRIKDLIDFPPDQATLDVFPMPSGRHGESGSVVYVAVARKERIKAKVELLRRAGVTVTAVDIAELVLRNLMARYPFDAEGAMLLRISRRQGATMIFRDRSLFISRDLNLGEEDLHNSVSLEQWSDLLDLPQEAQGHLDHIVLEVQRTLDYFESHFSLAPPKNLVMLPLAQEIPVISQYLSTMLGLEIHALDFNELLECETPLDDLQKIHCIGAIGAALRDWGDDWGDEA